MKLFAGIESFADEFAAFGQEALASAVRETIRRVRDEEREFWDRPLTIREASEWGGTANHSYDGLRKSARSRWHLGGRSGGGTYP